MSHLALYRKYRPQTFNDVRGQADAVSYLESIAQSGRVPHALLLTGSRGIGKTTLARIFGKSLGIDAHDIYEIDAASYRKVENMRELLNDMLTLPISSPYKLYILDEVHMLTNESFNTFLKTLEEPPKHVLFVLATTELHKVLPTVLSRCQIIHLKKPTLHVLVEQIIDVAKQEGKNITTEYAGMIAERANGSFRDALVLLDQLLEQVEGNEITQADINRLGIRASDYLAFEFISNIQSKNTDRLTQIVSEVSTDGKSLAEFLQKILNIMRYTLYVHSSPSLWKTAQEQLAADQIEMIESWAKESIITTDILARFLRAYEESKRSTIPAIPVELALIEILGNNTSR